MGTQASPQGTQTPSCRNQASPHSTAASPWSYASHKGTQASPGRNNALPQIKQTSPSCLLGETKHLPAHPGSICTEQLRSLGSTQIVLGIAMSLHGARKRLLRHPGISGVHKSVSSTHSSTCFENTSMSLGNAPWSTRHTSMIPGNTSNDRNAAPRHPPWNTSIPLGSQAFPWSRGMSEAEQGQSPAAA